ncbi:uncharacterized protein M6B38_206615 [Iris pallida]|uniref:Secreted protein n=1 Tax=Iris pallida TaxID=29817 RepID=A0AAX6E6M1_IRIPA|nr:uncharacterized protein M6B38_206615 [Iris pallida]
MEKPRYRKRPVICATLILLGLISFSCCVAAESRRVKDKDMRADGNLCSLPRRPAFWSGSHSARLPLRRPDCWYHFSSHHRPSRKDKSHEKPSCSSHTLTPILDQLRSGSSPIGHCVKHEQQAALWQRVDGREMLRRQERRIRGSGSAGRHDRRFNNRIHLRNTTYDCGRGKSRPVAGQTTPLFPSADTGIPCVRRQQLVMVVYRRKKSTETMWRGMNGMVSYLGNGWRPLVFFSYNSTCTHVLDRVYYIFMILGT